MIIWLVIVSIIAVVAFIGALCNSQSCTCTCNNLSNSYDAYELREVCDIHRGKINNLSEKLDALIKYLNIEYKPESNNKVPAHFEKKEAAKK